MTILELLIVLALLIAIGAMVAPAMVGVLDDQALDSTAEVVQQQLILARAHAQSSGRPVEVAYRLEPARIIARYFEAGERGIREGDRSAAARRGEDDPFAGGDVGRAMDDDDDVLVWNWARRPLPRGITVSRNAPANDRDGASLRVVEGFSPTPQPAPSREGEIARPIRLAVFMPDGSALLATPVWLANGRSRAVRVEVNVWTGLPRVGEHEQAVESREAAGGGRWN